MGEITIKNKLHRTDIPWFWGTLLVILTCGILLGGYIYYQYESERIQHKSYQELVAVAELKSTQIQQWRQSQLEDANALTKGPLFRKYVAEWLKNPAEICICLFVKFGECFFDIAVKIFIAVIAGGVVKII